MSKKRTNYSAEFKAKVISELFRGEKSLNKLAGTYQIAPATLSKWHKQFQENLPALFGKTDTSKDERIAELEQELQASQQKIGQLTIERDWLEKADEVFGPNGPHRTRFGRKLGSTMKIRFGDRYLLPALENRFYVPLYYH